MATNTIELYRQMHRKEGRFKGYHTLKHLDRIGALCAKHGAKTLLDYGSGKGRQYSKDRVHEAWGVEPTCYDPGVEAFAEKPSGTYDGVICVDALEHIEEPEIDGSLADIFGYITRFGYLAISTVPSKKGLPDGRNCHVTIMPGDWWLCKTWKAAHQTGTGPWYVSVDDHTTKHIVLLIERG